MKIIERRRQIIETLQGVGSADIDGLAEQLGVSSMTIRRDLKELGSNGSVSIKQGTALLADGTLREYNMLFKRSIHLEEKRRIGQKCLDYIDEGDSVYLDAGTTTRELALLLGRKKNISVMTHSLLVANAATAAKCPHLIMCPGEYRAMSMAFMGSLTDDFIRNFQIDLLFLSTEGVSLQSGVSVVDIADGHSKQTLIQQAKRVILMADSEKFEKALFYKIAPLDKLDLIITDSGLSNSLYDEYVKNGVVIERV